MGQEERATVEPEMPVALVRPGLLLPWVSLLIVALWHPSALLSREVLELT